MRHSPLILAAAFAALPSSAHAQWTVVHLHPLGAEESFLLGADGPRQFGAVTAGGVQRAIVWSGTADSGTSLAPAGWARSAAFGSNGSAVVGQVGNELGLSYATIWSGTAEDWTNLTPASTVGGSIYGAEGDVQVGLVYLPTTRHAAMWRGTAASFIDLHPAVAADSVVLAIGGGRQVGQARVNGFQHACLWAGTADSWVDLHPSGASYSEARGADGDQQAGYVQFGSSVRGGYWSGSADTWVDLTPPGATGSVVADVYAGLQVGNAFFVEGGQQACVWSGTASSCEFLPTPAGYHNVSPTCISGDAEHIYIGGWGGNMATQQPEALMWVKPRGPAPCGPADVAKAGGAPGPDGSLDNNDFIIFISGFFLQLPWADRGAVGGLAGMDGRFDNNDFIVFIDQFFAGC